MVFFRVKYRGVPGILVVRTCVLLRTENGQVAQFRRSCHSRMLSIEIRNGVDLVRKMNPLAVILSVICVRALSSHTGCGLMARNSTEPKTSLWLSPCKLSSEESGGGVNFESLRQLLRAVACVGLRSIPPACNNVVWNTPVNIKNNFTWLKTSVRLFSFASKLSVQFSLRNDDSKEAIARSFCCATFVVARELKTK